MSLISDTIISIYLYLYYSTSSGTSYISGSGINYGSRNEEMKGMKMSFFQFLFSLRQILGFIDKLLFSFDLSKTGETLKA